jgi:hypothetical protein
MPIQSTVTNSTHSQYGVSPNATDKPVHNYTCKTIRCDPNNLIFSPPYTTTALETEEMRHTSECIH